MARLDFELNIPATALLATTATTIAQAVAAANQRVAVKEIGLYFDNLPSNPGSVQIQINEVTVAGTSMQSATPHADEQELTETIQTTCTTWKTAQVEPSGTVSTLRTLNIPANQGMYERVWTYKDEITLKGGGILAITATATVGVNVRGYIKFEE